MEIDARKVKELREKTGVGMMDCKKALQETGGDFDVAIDYLRKKGIATSAKRADKEAHEGVVVVMLSEDHRQAAMVEVNCETDFVAKTDDFKEFAQTICQQTLGCDPGITADALLNQAYILNPQLSVTDQLNNVIAKTGERIVINRLVRTGIDNSVPGLIASYVHSNLKIGTLVAITCKEKSAATNEIVIQAAKDVCMQIAAASPLGLNRDSIDTTLIEKEKEIYREQMKNDKKPAQIIEKIIDGKIAKFFSEVCLLEQKFVKNQDQTISDYLNEISKQVGDCLTVINYWRFQLG